MNRRTLSYACGIVVALAATVPAVRFAEACFMRSPQPVQVWLDHINVDIVDQVAVKTYNCTFKNPNPQAVVGGTCYMELEPGAQVDDMSVMVDGKEMKAEILDVQKANEVFTDIVKNGGSPALLEYFGNQLIQTQVPRIAPNGTVTVLLKYTTVLNKRGGLVRLQMLNTNPKALMQSLQSAGVTVNIKSTEPIKNVYSPTHEIKLVEKEGWDISAQWSQENYLPKHPFVLYYQVSEGTVGASVVAHRELDEDGAFMLMLSPTLGQGTGKVTEEQVLPKDVIFCVDASGSMLEGGKMEQARGALKYCLETLRPATAGRAADRFNIVDFSTMAREFSKEGLVEFNDESKAKALKYAENLSARGGTAIQEALELSLKKLGDGAKARSEGRMQMVLFATDGLPTIGERDPEAILRKMAKQNTDGVRIFVFGEGFDVNTKLLDFLALEHRGEADYILPEEDIKEKIGRFFDRVGSPLMTDLEVTFEGLEVKDVYPAKIPDVFKGEQVILCGRYSGHGTKTIRVSGSINGRKETLEYTVEFPEYSDDDRHSFVPRLWAGKKVDFLLNEIRKTPEPPKELVDEVTYLAKRFGIVTPYTSFLMAEDMVSRDEAQLATQAGQRFRALNAPLAQSAPAEDKQDRVQAAKDLSEARREGGKSGGFAYFDKLAEEGLQRDGRTGSSLSAIRYIGTRTFYKQGDEWRESVYDAEKHKDVKTVVVGSDEYFKLLKEDGRLAKYLALGDVVLKVKETWYRFEEAGKKRS